MYTVDLTLRDPVHLGMVLAVVVAALVAAVVLARRKRKKKDPVSRGVRDWIEDGVESAAAERG